MDTLDTNSVGWMVLSAQAATGHKTTTHPQDIATHWVCIIIDALYYSAGTICLYAHTFHIPIPSQEAATEYHSVK